MDYINRLQNDPATEPHLAFLSVHGYTQNGVNPGGNRDQMADYYDRIDEFGKQSWQTEASGFGPSEWLASNGDGAIWISRAIHEGLVYGNHNAWLYWQMTNGDTSPTQREALTSVSGGVVDTDNPKYAAAKHYFKFIRPDSVRIEAGIDDVTGINISAYLNEEDQTLTIVILNMGTSDEFIDLVLPAGMDLSQFEMYRTNNNETFATLSPLLVNGSTASFNMLGSSIVTLYGHYTALVPEPASALLLVVAGGAALMCRRGKMRGRDLH
ncbi:MAG: PEP-CTERM sorting domain-containing protein [Phycisphaeraceae bacterium]